MILVTGGAGFIGANFVLDWIAVTGEPVVNLDALTYAGNRESLRSLDGDARHVFVHGDICDRALLDRLLAGHRPRAIVHFAAESHVDRSIHGPGAFINGDTTRAQLAADHGAESLAEETVPWVESDETALVLFPNEPAMRAEMFWFGETDGGPRHIRVNSPETQWIGSGGLTVGATLEQVEQANGGPFTLVGFQNHNEGETIDWLGGTFTTPASSNCHVDFIFGLPDGLTEAETVAVSADSQTAFRSDSPEMRAARPVVAEFAVSYASR